MAIWQKISDTLVEEIENGVLAPGGRLPGDNELATRFGVNRHTVRRALSHLQARGLVRAERGRGTVVVEDAITFLFGTQTRFEQNLLENTRTPSRQLLSTAVYGAPTTLAQLLQIKAGARVLTAVMLGEADGVPVHLTHVHFPVERFPIVEEIFASLPRGQSSPLSLAELVKRLGVTSFRRKNVRIKCRLPEAEEARQLKMAAHDPVFELNIVNVDEGNVPVFYAVTTYCGSRIEFVLDY